MQHHLSTIQSCIHNELEELELVIREALCSESKLAEAIGEHIMLHAGKRIRPAILILSALALGYNRDNGHHLHLGCMLELLHTATLLHDDILDDGKIRRNKTASHVIWGPHASILAGDYLFAKAFKIMTDLESLEILKILSQTTHDIVLGELKHIEMQSKIPENTLAYMQVISLKTARLFSSAAKIGALLAQSTPGLTEHAAEFGHHLGVLFQIQDDIMDYQAHPTQTGKPKHQDFLQRKPTLPLILAYQNASDSQKSELFQLFSHPETTFAQITPILEETHALDLCQKEAQVTRQLALSCLKRFEDNPYTQALQQFVEFALHRNH